MATKQKNTYGKRRRYKGKVVQPNGMPRSSMASAKIPGRTVKGPYGLCKPNTGFTKNPRYEVGQPSPEILKLRGPYLVAMPKGRQKVRGKTTAIVASIACLLVFLSGCSHDNRSDGEWARDVCLEHHGIRQFSPNGYYQDASVVCMDGYATARE